MISYCIAVKREVNPKKIKSADGKSDDIVKLEDRSLNTSAVSFLNETPTRSKKVVEGTRTYDVALSNVQNRVLFSDRYSDFLIKKYINNFF